jgi:RNA polymerase sigma-70 factor (ECF subfamily)
MTLAGSAGPDHAAAPAARQSALPAVTAHATPAPLLPEAQIVALVEQTLGGEQAAFMQLVEWHTGSVYALTRRMLGNALDAEDAGQETFLRAYRNLARFDRSRRFKTWLLAIAANYCIDRLRQRRDNQVSLDAVPCAAAASDTREPEAQTLRAEERRLVRQALHQLPANYRQLSLLRYWHDLSYREMERVTGLSEAIIKSRLYRARQMLARALEPE